MLRCTIFTFVLTSFRSVYLFYEFCLAIGVCLLVCPSLSNTVSKRCQLGIFVVTFWKTPILGSAKQPFLCFYFQQDWSRKHRHPFKRNYLLVACWAQDTAALIAELEQSKQNASDLTEQLNTTLSEHSALVRRMEEQQTQIALQRSHMKKQIADQRKRLVHSTD